MTTQDRLAYLLADLESNRLITVLVPSKRSDRRDWDMLRCNMSVSPIWYQQLCSRHPSKRGVRRGRFDTIIRRHRIEQTLRTMIAGRKPSSIYAEELKTIAAKIKL